MKEIFTPFNPWWQTTYKTNTILRKKYIEKLKTLLNTKDIIILTGLRRVGKTTLLYQIIEHLLQKVSKKHIFYISLDLLSIKNMTIYQIIQEYRSIQKITMQEMIYVFLDEITVKEHFQQELKNLYDLGNIKIFVSSSSATKLKDTHAYLTGRARYIEIEPLDFCEFLQFRNYTISPSNPQLYKSYFEEYMEFGGIPEYVLQREPTYISDLTRTIIYKDIIAKYAIRNTEAVFDLFTLLIERVGKPISYTRLANILNISVDSVQTYISYFLETYLFYQITMTGKLNERIKGPKKLYAGDVGLKNVTHGFKDKGSIYENLVFLKIKSETNEFIHFLYKDGIEIDFYFGDTLIEAKFGQEMTEKQKKLFDSSKAKNKIIAEGVEFFLE
ncbi:MAG: ATP-binding protein [Candidatus Woesearchaeota archaeon]